jgi:hypothetical protein
LNLWLTPTKADPDESMTEKKGRHEPFQSNVKNVPYWLHYASPTRSVSPRLNESDSFWYFVDVVPLSFLLGVSQLVSLSSFLPFFSDPFLLCLSLHSTLQQTALSKGLLRQRRYLSGDRRPPHLALG